MVYIKVKYSDVNKTIKEISDLISDLENVMSSYETLIRNIANYPEWKGVEKGRILSTAAGPYYNYYNSLKENVDTLKQQIVNKKDEFLEAEK